MNKIPIFTLPFKGTKELESILEPYKSSLRDWKDLTKEDKQKMYLYFEREYKLNDWYSFFRHRAIYHSWMALNDLYISNPPFTKLNNIPLEENLRNNNHQERAENAFEDFQEIFFNWNEKLFFHVIWTIFKIFLLSSWYDELTSDSTDEDIEKTFKTFDHLIEVFNKVSESFGLNVKFSRNWIIPVQEEKITEDIYIPTINLLQGQKWKTSNDELKKAFERFSDKDFSWAIGFTHNFVQDFLCNYFGKKSPRWIWAFSNWIKELKNRPDLYNKYTEGIISTIGNFIPQERATKTDAKPWEAIVDRDSALLVMNSALVLVNYLINKDPWKK